MPYLYYELPNGNLISKEKVDRAYELIAQLNNGYNLVELTESELFTKGDKFEAVYAFYKKNKCSLVEAKAAIELMRKQ